MSVVGTNAPRTDGRAKVTGEALYVDDIAIDGVLHARTVRSTCPRGRLDAVRLDPEYDWSDVVCVTAEDLLARGGENVVHLFVDDQPVLAHGAIEHPEEPVALVAAPTREKAAEAARHVLLDVTPLPPVLDPALSERPASRLTVANGDLDAAFARADRVVEGEYRTFEQEQLYIEPQGLIGIPRDGGGVTVKGSMQCPYFIHRALKRALGLSDEQVSVVQTVTGGGFGGKEEYPSIMACHVALLALRAGRPVKLVYDRGEDLRATTHRHASVVRHRTGVMDDGTLVAADIDITLDCGAYVTLSPVVLSRAVLHATGPYRYEACRVTSRAMLTNSVPAGAFRGFGAPQATFAYERHLDRIARELGMDVLEIRRKNTVREGDALVTGQLVAANFGGPRVLERAVQKSRFEERRRTLSRVADDPETGARRRRGIGLSYFFHGAGFTGNGEERLKGKVAVELLAAGRARICTASIDMGQGAETVFAQVAADTLGVGMEAIEMAPHDTSLVPDSGPTVASRTTMVVGKVVEEACKELLETVTAGAPRGASFAEAGDAWLAERGPLKVLRTYESDPRIRWDDATYRGDAYPCFASTCDVAEVEVDLDTAEVEVKRFLSVVDIGTVIHPVMAAGQVEGGNLQAIGFAQMEQVVMKEGAKLTDRMTNYIVPTALDAPEMDVEFIEIPYDYGAFGAKGLGEMPMDGGAPAVLQAVEHALGVPVPAVIPLTPERLLPVVAALCQEVKP